MTLIEIAQLEEARQANAARDVADEWRPVGGGVAARADPGSWLNNAVNVGMSGPVERAELEGLCAWWEERGIEPRVELCPYADATAVAALAALGFVPRAFEGVLFREVGMGDTGGTLVLLGDMGTGDTGGTPVLPGVAGVEVRPVEKADVREVRAYVEAVVPPFYPPGQSPSESDFETAARAVRHPRTVSLAAWAEGRIVGGGSMEVCGGAAGLFGASVLGGFRRRGVQSLLIAERLRIARERGARVATIAARLSREPSGTERNARRAGFQVGYTKVIVVRPGEGLAGVRGS
ncbi:MAG: GNAT family N-acetyltransferase [Phycisphaerales bacterium]